jgi:hypothetical protein
MLDVLGRLVEQGALTVPEGHDLRRQILRHGRDLPSRPPRTVWRLTGVPDLGRHDILSPLDIRLVVDTTAAAVVDAIEEAAAATGIRLERIEEER